MSQSLADNYYVSNPRLDVVSYRLSPPFTMPLDDEILAKISRLNLNQNDQRYDERYQRTLNELRAKFKEYGFNSPSSSRLVIPFDDSSLGLSLTGTRIIYKPLNLVPEWDCTE